MGPETALAVGALISATAAAAGTGVAIQQAAKGPPDLPEPAPLPPEAATPPEPAPIQPAEFEVTSRQRARRASARARTAARTDQTILTSRLGTAQSPQNVRRTVLG